MKTLVTAGPFTVGQSISYTLQVGNTGPSTATSVQVTDTPTNLTITGVSGGGCTALPCTIPSLASGASVTINVTATINASGAFDNAATALAAETDPNLANNTDNSGNGRTAGALADVSLVKTLVTAGPFTIGQSISYTLQVGNAGPSTATSVQVTDTRNNVTLPRIDCTPINQAPTVAADNASVTANEGSGASNTGTFGDGDGDAVTLAASGGTVTPGSGTWSWSFTTTDGPAESQTVTITATDAIGASTSTTFALVVQNVAPTVNAGADASIVTNQSYNFSDSVDGDACGTTVSLQPVQAESRQRPSP